MGQIDGAKGGTYSSKPSNVVSAKIDMKSGLLATDASTNTRTEYFTSGTEPKEAGTLNQVAQVCSDSGYLATPSCSHTKSKSGVMRPYVPSKNVGDYKNELPHYYCNLHNPNPEVYPTEPGKKVTIVEEPITEPDPEPIEPTDPSETDPVTPPDSNKPDDNENGDD